MIRANLLPRPKESWNVLGVALDLDYLRQGACAAACVAAAALLVGALQFVRYERAADAASAAETVLSGHIERREAARKLALDVARLQRIARTADRARRTGTEAAVVVARIGNMLPAHVWLESLQQTATGYDLVGSSADLERLSAAVAALAGALPGRVPSLAGLEHRSSAPIRFTAHLNERVSK